MGINIPANSSLGSFSSIFFPIFFFFSAKMNLTVFAGILLAINMATARRASLGEKTMQADEPEEAMRESARPASLVEKNMRAADEAGEPAGAKRANGGQKMNKRMKQRKPIGCYYEISCANQKRDPLMPCCYMSPAFIPRPGGVKGGELEAKRESLGQKMNKRMKQRKPIRCYYEISCANPKRDPLMPCCYMGPAFIPRPGVKSGKLEAKRESLEKKERKMWR